MLLSTFWRVRDNNAGSCWPELREAQMKTLSVPRTGMAVITDIGNANDIHLTNKQDVDRRLAAIAFNKSYGFDVRFSGPVYETMRVENGRAVVKFGMTYGTLIAKDRYGYVRGFEIAGVASATPIPFAIFDLRLGETTWPEVAGALH